MKLPARLQFEELVVLARALVNRHESHLDAWRQEFIRNAKRDRTNPASEGVSNTDAAPSPQHYGEEDGRRTPAS